MKSLLVPMAIGMGLLQVAAAHAVPLQRYSVETPSKFERLVDRIDDISQPVQKTVELGKYRIQSLQQLVKIATADPFLPITSSITNEYTHKQALPAPQLTVRKLARALVNRGTNPVVEGQNPDDLPAANSNAAVSAPSFLEFILASQLNEEFIQAATAVVRPSLGPDGMISLNLMGLRDFTVFVSSVTNKIQIFDLKTGNNITVANNTGEQRPKARIPQNQYQTPQQERYRTEATTISLVKILKLLQKITMAYLFHPLTMVTFVFVMGGWVFFRMGRDTA